ncbi:MAG: hypothetical protein ACTHNS_03565 [Marmoricola sp.]
MVSVLLLLVLCLVVAGAVAVYAAYVHRGEEVPHAPWLGDAMRRGVAALPTLDNHPRQRLEIQRRAVPALQTARATALSSARSTARSLRDRVPAQR